MFTPNIISIKPDMAVKFTLGSCIKKGKHAKIYFFI